MKPIARNIFGYYEKGFTPGEARSKKGATPNCKLHVEKAGPDSSVNCNAGLRKVTPVRNHGKH